MSSSSRMILVALFVFLLAGIIFLSDLLGDDQNQFRLLQTPEPVPVLTLPPESPGYVPDQTLQSSPAVIDKEAAPGEEIEPLLVTNTIDQDLLLQVRFRSESSPEALVLSEKDLLLPANTKQNIGIRLREGLREDVFGSIVIRTAIKAGTEGGAVAGKKILIQPSLALEVPVALRLPLGREVPQWALGLPQLEPFSGGWRPEIAIQNISRRIVSGQGTFSLRGQGGNLEASLSDNQFVAPGSRGTLMGSQIWNDLRPGTYTLVARVQSGGQIKKTARKVIIDKGVRPVPTQSGALLIEKRGQKLFLIVRNNGDLAIRGARAILNEDVINRKQLKIPDLLPGEAREVSIPPGPRVNADLLWRGKSLDSVLWQDLPVAAPKPESERSWIWVPLLIAGLAGVLIVAGLLFLSRRKKKRPKESLRRDDQAGREKKRSRRRRRYRDGRSRPRLVPSYKRSGRRYGQKRYIRKR